jgi:hypothetical protein
MGSEGGLTEQYRAVIEGSYPTDEPVVQRGKVEPALWGRRRSHLQEICNRTGYATYQRRTALSLLRLWGSTSGLIEPFSGVKELTFILSCSATLHGRKGIARRVTGLR